MIRDLNIGDLVHLEGHALFPLANLSNKPMLFEKTIEDDKGLIGSIFINKTVELSAIFDPRAKRIKIAAMKDIEDFIIKNLIPRGIRDVHAFVCDPKFANFLVEHFGFEYAMGRALVRRF